MAGFDNDVVYADNVDFSGGTPVTGKVTTNGQLLIGSTAAPNVRVGALASADGSITITTGAGTIDLSASGGLPYISLSPYIVGSDVHCNYSTIQAAINAVNSAPGLPPAVIYVKPGTYTENLTIPSSVSGGIIITGFSPSYTMGSFIVSDPRNILSPNVFIDGTITVSGGKATFVNIYFSQSSTSVFHFSQGYIELFGCFNSIAGVGASLFTLTTDLTKEIYIKSSYLRGHGGGGGNLIATDGTTGTLRIISSLSQYEYLYPSTITATANFYLSHESDYCSNSWVIDCPAFSYENKNCPYITGSNGSNCVVTSTATVTSGSFTVNNSYISGPSSGLFDFTLGSGISWTVSNSSFQGTNTYTESNSNSTRGNNLFVNTSGLIFGAATTGWQGSLWKMNQAFLHTTSASAQTLITIPVASGTTMTVSGIISAANAGHTDMTGGRFCVTADGTAAAIVNTPIIEVNATSTGTFTATFSGGNLLIRVTAPSVAAYNWASTYELQPLISNS